MNTEMIQNQYGHYEEMVNMGSYPQRSTAKAILIRGAWYPKSVVTSKYMGAGETRMFVPVKWYNKKRGDHAKYTFENHLHDIEQVAENVNDASKHDEFSSANGKKRIDHYIEKLTLYIACYLEDKERYYGFNVF